MKTEPGSYAWENGKLLIGLLNAGVANILTERRDGAQAVGRGLGIDERCVGEDLAGLHVHDHGEPAQRVFGLHLASEVSFGHVLQRRVDRELESDARLRLLDDRRRRGRQGDSRSTTTYSRVMPV